MTEVGSIFFDANLNDAGLLEAVVRAAKRASKAAKVTFEADADFADLAAKAKIAAARARTSVKMTVDLDTKRLRRELSSAAAGAERAFADMSKSVESGLAAMVRDLGKAGEAFDGLFAGGEGGGGVGALTASFSRLGKSAVSSFGAIGAGLGLLKAGLFLKVVQVVEALGGGLIALAGQVVKASGALIPFAGVLASVAAVVPTVLVGLTGLGDAFGAVAKAQELQSKKGKRTKAETEALNKALKAQREALDKLAPSAADFVTEVVKLQKPFASLAKSVQGRLFKGLGDDLKDTATAVLPALRTGLGAVATQVNKVADGFLDWVGSAKGTKAIQTFLTDSAKIIPGLAKGIGGFGSGLLTLLHGSAGPAKTLADTIGNLGTRFSDWTKTITKGGKNSPLSKFIADAQETVGKLKSIVGNVIGIFDGLFKASDPAGSGLLDRINDVTGAFKNWLKIPENQAALTSFFGTVYTDLVLLGRAAKIAADALALLTLTPFSPEWNKTFQTFKNDLAHLGDDVPPINVPQPKMPDSGTTQRAYQKYLDGVTGKGKAKPQPVIVVPQWQLDPHEHGFPTITPPPTQTVNVPVDPIPVLSPGAKFWQTLVEKIKALSGSPFLVPQKIDVPVDPQPQTTETFGSDFLKHILDKIRQGIGSSGFGKGIPGLTGAISAGQFVAPLSSEQCQQMFACIPGSAQNAADQGASTLQRLVDQIRGLFAGLAIDIPIDFGALPPFPALPHPNVQVGTGYAPLPSFPTLPKPKVTIGLGYGPLPKFPALPSPTVHVKVAYDPSKLTAKGVVAQPLGGFTPDRTAAGIHITRGPEYRIIGEAGPEAVVPLRRSQPLDPAVTALLTSVAASRGLIGNQGPTVVVEEGASLVSISTPTNDPAAIAMMTINRLALVRTV